MKRVSFGHYTMYYGIGFGDFILCLIGTDNGHCVLISNTSVLR